MNPVARERVRSVCFMVGLTAVVISVVTTIQLATAGLVERNRTAYLKRAILEAAGMACPEDTVQMLAIFDRSVSAGGHTTAPEPSFYTVRETVDGPVKAVAFKRTGVGLWGKIVAVVGLDSELKTMTGIVFVEQNETPGLGARIVEPWFRTQFRGKRAPFRLAPEGKASGHDEINAVTGATITTRGVKDMLEKLFAEAPGIVGPGGG